MGVINPFRIPSSWKTDDVYLKIYKDINYNLSLNSVILTSHNEDSTILNNKILTLINSDEMTYYSIDGATHKGVDLSDDNIDINFPIE